MYLGIDLQKFDPFVCDKKKNNPPIILWNHRWEYDKNPDKFFEAMQHLSDEKIDFQLAILGKEFKDEISCFTHARKELKKHIIQFGFTTSFNDHAHWLSKADILPVTSNQDFFGASIMEAVYCNTIPLLPNRLTYPELFNKKKNNKLFYEDMDDFLLKLKELIANEKILHNNNYQSIAKEFDWGKMANHYDEKFELLI